jgi:hypothetical protein
MGARAGYTHDTLAPELRKDYTANGVHIRYNPTPPGERLFAVHVREVNLAEPGFAQGGRMINSNTFRDNQPRVPFRTPPIIGRDVLPGDSVWREAARHRCHDNAISQAYTADVQRLKQGRGGSCRAHRGSHCEWYSKI